MNYSEKLKDPKWQKKRLEILQRDNWTCRSCDQSTKTLQVHHVNYSNNPWDANETDLITLCDECHKTWHNIFDKCAHEYVPLVVKLHEDLLTLEIKHHV